MNCTMWRFDASPEREAWRNPALAGQRIEVAVVQPELVVGRASLGHRRPIEAQRDEGGLEAVERNFFPARDPGRGSGNLDQATVQHGSFGDAECGFLTDAERGAELGALDDQLTGDCAQAERGDDRT